jgi:transposase
MKKVENQLKKWNFFVGVDVSKLTWDLTVLSLTDRTFQHHMETPNSHEGWDEVLAWLESKGVDVSQSLFCMESTGVYCHTLLACLSAYGYDTWVENALRIKSSSGILRGKTDKQDSLMIANYARRNYEEVRLYSPTRVKLERMKVMMKLRESLIKHRNGLLRPLKEQEDMGVPLAGEYKSLMKNTIAGFEKDIAKIEARIGDIIATDEHFKELHDLITSVVGVGTRTAVAMIVYTNEFENFTDARQLACYCGVVPFAKESGSSVRGRTKVSKMCNHTLKSLLHLSALSAVRYDPELKAYYEKKKAEGKNPMLVLNAVRNKLVHRIFAVVRRKKPFEKYDYFKAA